MAVGVKMKALYVATGTIRFGRLSLVSSWERGLEGTWPTMGRDEGGGSSQKAEQRGRWTESSRVPKTRCQLMLTKI